MITYVVKLEMNFEIEDSNVESKNLATVESKFIKEIQGSHFSDLLPFMTTEKTSR